MKVFGKTRIKNQKGCSLQDKTERLDDAGSDLDMDLLRMVLETVLEIKERSLEVLEAIFEITQQYYLIIFYDFEVRFVKKLRKMWSFFVCVKLSLGVALAMMPSMCLFKN